MGNRPRVSFNERTKQQVERLRRLLGVPAAEVVRRAVEIYHRGYRAEIRATTGEASEADDDRAEEGAGR